MSLPAAEITSDSAVTDLAVPATVTAFAFLRMHRDRRRGDRQPEHRERDDRKMLHLPSSMVNLLGEF